MFGRLPGSELGAKPSLLYVYSHTVYMYIRTVLRVGKPNYFYCTVTVYFC